MAEPEASQQEQKLWSSWELSGGSGSFHRLLSQSGAGENYDLLRGFEILKSRFSTIFRHLDQAQIRWNV